VSLGCHNHGPHGGADGGAIDPRLRRALVVALIANGIMALVEIGAGWQASSSALLADALDFLGDTATYAVSLFVLSRSASWKAGAAVAKSAAMALFGMVVLAQAGYSAVAQPLPSAPTMGVVGTLALLVNLGVALLLFTHRGGDANVRSVWLCSRNDAIGNVAVLVAAAGVFGTGSVWPDLAVALIMASLALWASASILRQASGEWRAARRETGQAAIRSD